MAHLHLQITHAEYLKAAKERKVKCPCKVNARVGDTILLFYDENGEMIEAKVKYVQMSLYPLSEIVYFAGCPHAK